MLSRTCSAVAQILLVASSFDAPIRAEESLQAQLDEIFVDFDGTNSPGCALGVIRNGELVVHRGYGMASLEHGVPNSSSAVYYIGSTSKQFVAASLLLAAEKGHLSLDDDIRNHLPELPAWQAPITIRHLVHHTSGLRDYLTLMYLADMRFEDVHSNTEIIELIGRQKELNFTPGDEYLYSNSGYFLLAEIVGRATGKSLREFAQENIFAPLGMSRTHFHDDRSMVVPGRATAYKADERGGFELDFYLNFDKVGSGGLLTTIEDLARWDRNFDQNKLGKGSLIEDMLVRGVLNDGEELSYAFAIGHGDYRGLRTLSHSGGFMGFRAQLLRFPDDGLSVVCLCNVGHANPSAFAFAVGELYLEDRMDPELGMPERSDEPATKVIGNTVQELEKHTGNYRENDGVLVRKIRVEDGKLWYVRSEENKSELLALAPGRFRMQGTQVDVVFEPAKPDVPARMVVIIPGDDAVFTAYEPWKPESKELAPFAGSFYNEELDVVHRFEIRDGLPVLMIGRNPEEHPIEPVVPGEFAGDEFTLTFTGSGAIGTMIMDAGRVKNLRFERVEGGRAH